jgi:hypothetical protein
MLRYTCRRTIKNHYIYTPGFNKEINRVKNNVNPIQLDLLNTRNGMVGEIKFNNPVFGNVLNNSMISSLHRSIMSMELDSDIKVILLKAEKDFNLGTDYECN